MIEFLLATGGGGVDPKNVTEIPIVTVQYLVGIRDPIELGLTTVQYLVPVTLPIECSMVTVQYLKKVAS